MSRSAVRLAAVAVLLLALSTPTHAQQPARPVMPGAAYVAPLPRALSPAIPVTTLADAAGIVDLGPPTGEELAPEVSAEGVAMPLRIGVERVVDASDGRMDGASAWRPLADGSRMATLALRSPGAVGLRVALRVVAPAETLLLVHEPGVADPANEPLRAADARRPAGRSGVSADAARGEVWSAVVDGDTVLVDVVAPAGVSVQRVRVRVDRVAHLLVSPTGAYPNPGGSLSCQRDIACDGAWRETGDAVAHYVFQANGGAYICTGTLMNTTSEQLYFLTAAHCVRTGAEASTMSLYWLYERTSCSGNQYTVKQSTGGARLMRTTGPPEKRGSPDTTLVRLYKSPPSGVNYAGWDPGRQGRKVVRGIHHPSGDLKKISKGKIRGTASWTGGKAAHHLVLWKRGATEGGSSGSGLFTGRRWPNQYLVGVLSGGPTPTCRRGEDYDLYGRLDLAYRKLGKWLR